MSNEIKLANHHTTATKLESKLAGRSRTPNRRASTKRPEGNLLYRLRWQSVLLKRDRRWNLSTAELHELVRLATQTRRTKKGRPLPVWYKGYEFSVRETLITTSVLDPDTNEPLASVWSI